MKKKKTRLFLILSLLIPIYSCMMEPALKPLPGSSKIPTPTPVPTILVSQSNGAWTVEDDKSNTSLTITKRADNIYDFVGIVKPKDGGEIYNTVGNVKYIEKEAVFMYSKPGSAMVRASYEIQDNGNTIIYSITNSDTALAKIGQKYTYKKAN